MGALQIIGIACGGCALFFALVAGILYSKINKLFYLISDDQIEQVMPIVEKQKKRVYLYVTISTICTIATVVLSIVRNV